MCARQACCPNLLVGSVSQVVEDEVPLPSCQQHSPEFADLIKQCLEKDPYKRPTAEALLGHPFLRKVAAHAYLTPPRLLTLLAWLAASSLYVVLPLVLPWPAADAT